MPMFTNETLVTGSLDVNNFPAVQPITDNGGSLTVDGTVTVANPGLTDTQLRATPVPVTIPIPVPVTDNSGSLTVDGTVAVSNFPGASTSTATVTSVSVGTSVVTLSASNAGKTKVILYNETGTLFVKYGSAASSSSYTTRLTANTSYEVDGYHGIITAIKASGTTPVLVTELGI